VKVWFQDPAEPVKLVLAWQAPDGVEDRRRWQIGFLERGESAPQFRYLEGMEFKSANAGRSVEDMRRQGFVSFPAFEYVPGKVFKDRVMETFGRRIPPTSRSDFARYLEYFSIRPSEPVPEFTLFALTEARLPGDGFSLVDPLEPDLATGEVPFEIAGFRHEAKSVALEVGQTLSLVPEPTNEHDRHAIQVLLGDQRIGYVNRIQAPTIGQWLDTRTLECVVLRFNGRPGAPRVYAMLRISKPASKLAA
jgi:hypothetical protein